MIDIYLYIYIYIQLMSVMLAVTRSIHRTNFQLSNSMGVPWRVN